MAFEVDKNLGFIAIAASIGAVGLLSFDAYTHVDKGQASYEFPSLDTRQSGNRSRVQDVISAYLFGKIPAVVAVEEDQPKAQADKVLNVQISGLMSSTDAKYAMAVLTVDGDKPKTYRVGDSLGDKNIVLKSVDALKIIVNYYGEEQEVLLKRPELASRPRQDSAGIQSFDPGLPPDDLLPEAQTIEPIDNQFLDPIEPPLVDNDQNSSNPPPSLDESEIAEIENQNYYNQDNNQPVDVSRQKTPDDYLEDPDAPPSPYVDELPANVF